MLQRWHTAATVEYSKWQGTGKVQSFETDEATDAFDVGKLGAIAELKQAELLELVEIAHFFEVGKTNGDQLPQAANAIDSLKAGQGGAGGDVYAGEAAGGGEELRDFLEVRDRRTFDDDTEPFGSVDDGTMLCLQFGKCGALLGGVKLGGGEDDDGEQEQPPEHTSWRDGRTYVAGGWAENFLGVRFFVVVVGVGWHAR